MSKLEFKLVEPSRANKTYMFVNYKGGDTDHPEETLLEGVVLQDDLTLDEASLQKINEEVVFYKTLEKVLDQYHTDNNPYDEIKEEYSEEMADAFDNAPDDPQNDYQFKCTLGRIEVIAYDSKGNKYKSHTYNVE
jgi:hypothetical protein